ncbi:hypothetical protein FBR04_05860 [Betaproteobacteria bacterium PRO7]|nr:hypothetical protein [Betaproteobacteria bacterium PRO7]
MSWRDGDVVPHPSARPWNRSTADSATAAGAQVAATDESAAARHGCRQLPMRGSAWLTASMVGASCRFRAAPGGASRASGVCRFDLDPSAAGHHLKDG